MSTRFNISSNAKTPTLNSLTIKDLGGVDLTNSPLNVAPNRASSMSNFIKQNGVNQKRYGWNEILQFPIVYQMSNGAPVLVNGKKVQLSSNKINGIWEFDTSFVVTANNVKSFKKEHHIIVQAGTRFYRVSTFKDNSADYTWLDSSTEITNELIASNTKGLIQEVRIKDSVTNKADLTKVADKKSYGVASGNRLYILCGDYLVYGSWDNGSTFELRKVYNDADTFIPTTTMSIVADSTGYDLTNMNIRVAYDDINMLTKWRKNTLLGNATSDTTHQSNVVFTLDSPCSNANTMIVKCNGTTMNSGYSYATDNDGYGKLTITSNTAPTIEGADNYEVLFEVDNEYESYKIRECTFGILYGSNGIRDRLFVSGNSDYPNIDWHSTETNNGNDGEQDLTYFSPLDYCKYGNTTNEVMGYEILGDGTLLVMKSSSSQEPTIYTRVAKLIQATSYDGTLITDIDGNTMYEEAYPLSVGNIGEGCINSNSLVSLNGDTLMLSKNGVYGIVLGDNVATSQRYARERSRLISGELAKYDLSQACCITNDNKYYIALDTKCFIADSRYTFRLEDDLTNTYQYEWWVWDNIPARIFYSKDNTLYFGTSEGQVCAFTGKSYTDKTYSKLESGEITYDTTNKLFIVNEEHINDLEYLHNDDTYSLESSDTAIYGKVLDTTDFEITEDGEIQITNEDIEDKLIIYMQNFDFYCDTITNGGTSIVVDRDYGILYDDGTKVITLTYDSEDVVIPSTCTFRLVFKLPESNSVYDVQDSNGLHFKNYLEENGKHYKVDDEGVIEEELSSKPKFNRFKIANLLKSAPIDIVLYNGSQTVNNYSGTFEFNEIVKCYYITPMFDLGTTIYSKTLQSVAMTPDAILGSRIQFGYETRKNNKDYEAFTGQGFDFSKLEFATISFSTDVFACSWVKKCKEKKVNFIRFVFKNNTRDECKINNLTLTYYISSMNKGIN